MPAMAETPVTICRAMVGVTLSFGTSDQVNFWTPLVGIRKSYLNRALSDDESGSRMRS
jgi:hypothetical protein